jgi:NADH-quinone oxidoreductase subunit E
MQVNYDFHDDLTTVKVDEIIERYRSGQTKGAK